MDQKEVMLTQYTPRAAGKAIITGIDTIGIANITLREELLVFFGSAKKNSTCSVLSRTKGYSVCKSAKKISKTLVDTVTFFVFFSKSSSILVGHNAF